MDDRDEGHVLVHGFGPQEASLFAKFVRAAGPYAREAIRKAKDMGRKFNYRQTPSLTRSEFDTLKKEMEQALYEMKKAAKNQQKAQAQFASRLSADNLKLKQMLETLASELKTAMETEAKNGRLSQEKVAELTKLVNQLTKRVRELEVGNTARSRSLLSDIENILKTASRYRTLYSQLKEFITIVIIILSDLGYKPPEKHEGPSNFEDLGKETMDLFSEEHFCGWKLSVFPGFETDLLFSAGQSVLNGVSTNHISAAFCVDNLAGLVTYKDNGNLTTKWSLDELFGQQGLLCNLHLDYPFSGKLELLSKHKYACVRASVGLRVNPVTYLSILLGTKGKMFGGSIEVDTAQGRVTRYSAGAKYRSDKSSLSLTVNNLSEITASLHRECWDNTSVGAQLVRSLVTGETRLSAGVEYAANPAFVLKARGNHKGLVSALGRIQFSNRASVTISAEVDVRAIRQAPQVGLSFRFDGRRV